MSNLKLKFDAIVCEMTFVKSNLKYHREEHANRRKIFFSDLHEFMADLEYEFSDQKLEKNVIDVYKRHKAAPVPKISDQSKKIFKKIAAATHPDRHPEAHINKMFIEAKEAQEQGDWFSLYEISTRLDIDMPEPSKEQIKWMESEIEKLKIMIARVINTLEWIYSNDGACKQQIMTSYCMATCVLKGE
tara:strand:- start:1968 stop:2531 length:564 start_codon:yes stop_codon:yes gene_type:complete